MVLNDVFDSSESQVQDAEQDNSRPSLKDLRKTKLTLKDINRLRMMNDVRNYEKNERLKAIKKQYGAQPQGGM